MNTILDRTNEIQGDKLPFFADILVSAYTGLQASQYDHGDTLTGPELLIIPNGNTYRISDPNDQPESEKIIGDLNLLIKDSFDWYSRGDPQLAFQNQLDTRIRKIQGVGNIDDRQYKKISQNITDLIYEKGKGGRTKEWIIHGESSISPRFYKTRIGSLAPDHFVKKLKTLENKYLDRIADRLRFFGLAAITPAYIEELKSEIRQKFEKLEEEPSYLVSFQSIPLSIAALLWSSPKVIAVLYAAFYSLYVRLVEQKAQFAGFPTFGVKGGLSGRFNFADFNEFVQSLLWGVFLVSPLLIISVAVLFEFKIFDLTFVWNQDLNSRFISVSDYYRTPLSSWLNLLCYLVTLMFLFRMTDDRPIIAFGPRQITSVLLSIIIVSITVTYALENADYMSRAFSTAIRFHFTTVGAIKFSYMLVNLAASIIAYKRGNSFLLCVILALQLLPVVLVRYPIDFGPVGSLINFQ